MNNSYNCIENHKFKMDNNTHLKKSILKQTRQWEELDSSYRTQITKALRMAKKQLAPDLLMLPVAITD